MPRMPITDCVHLQVRIPRTLHAQIAHDAALAGQSKEQYVLGLLTAAVEKEVKK